MDELYKKDLSDPDNYDDVITHSEPGILECKVMWALGSITTSKASGVNGGLPQTTNQLTNEPTKNAYQGNPS